MMASRTEVRETPSSTASSRSGGSLEPAGNSRLSISVAIYIVNRAGAKFVNSPPGFGARGTRATCEESLDHADHDPGGRPPPACVRGGRQAVLGIDQEDG